MRGLSRFVLSCKQVKTVVFSKFTVTILFPLVLRTPTLLHGCGRLDLLGHFVAAEADGLLAAELARLAWFQRVLGGAEVLFQSLGDYLLEGLLIGQVHNLVDVDVKTGVGLGAVRQDLRIVETLVHQAPGLFWDLVLRGLFHLLVRVIAVHVFIEARGIDNNLLLFHCTDNNR